LLYEQYIKEDDTKEAEARKKEIESRIKKSEKEIEDRLEERFELFEKLELDPSTKHLMFSPPGPKLQK